jgi:hypothetical protein
VQPETINQRLLALDQEQRHPEMVLTKEKNEEKDE